MPDFWRKEYLGLKNNTVRTFSDVHDLRKELLDKFIDNQLNFLSIDIENTLTHEVFTRLVQDVTKYNDIYIITWRQHHDN